MCTIKHIYQDVQEKINVFLIPQPDTITFLSEEFSVSPAESVAAG